MTITSASVAVEEDIEKAFQEAQEGRDELKEDFEKFLADAEADGVVWSEVEFVSVDTSEVVETKSSTMKEGDIEVTLSHKGKNYVLHLDDCHFISSTGWFITDRPRWKGD